MVLLNVGSLEFRQQNYGAAQAAFEASLAFLGLGTQPPTPSWGAMLNSSRAYLRNDPWMAICPGVVLALLLLGLNYLADALRDAFDPRRVNAGL